MKLDLVYFLSEEKREEEKDLENSCPKKQMGVGLKINCPSKRKKESKVKQVRRGVRSPVRSAGKRIVIESLPQIDSKITACYHFMQSIKKSACTKHGWQLEPIGK